MKDSQSVYAYFDYLLNLVFIEIESNLMRKKYSKPETALYIIREHLLALKSALAQNPAVSNVNFEQMVNSVVLDSRKNNYEIDGVIITLAFKENYQVENFYKFNPIILKK